MYCCAYDPGLAIFALGDDAGPRDLPDVFADPSRLVPMVFLNLAVVAAFVSAIAWF